MKKADGLRISRLFTAHRCSPYEGIDFVERLSELKNPDGSEASASISIVVPDNWSSVASDIMAQKYFRRKGVPDGGCERDVRQVFHRLAGCWQK